MKSYRVIIIFCAIIFVALCFFHYFSQRPLWLDENFILQNIQELSFKNILGPLIKNQAFPRIYLIIIKWFSAKFDYVLLSLRFFPLISMIAGFIFWTVNYNKNFSNRWLSFLAIFSFLSSYYMSYYAAELKPYSMDVLVVGLFAMYLPYQKALARKTPSKPFIIATLLLPFTILFSYASFFVFWIVIYNLLYITRKNIKTLPLLISYFLLSLLFFIVVFNFDLRFSLQHKGLVNYWSDYFLCTDSGYCFFKSFGEGTRKLAVWWFGNSSIFRKIASFFIPFFFISMFFYGIKSLKKNGLRIFDLESLSIVVFLELFILGMLKMYPFTGERVTLFFAPFVFYMIVKAIAALKRVKILYYLVAVFYLCFLATCLFNTLLCYLKLYT